MLSMTIVNCPLIIDLKQVFHFPIGFWHLSVLNNIMLKHLGH
jgi:hypothetical protein